MSDGGRDRALLAVEMWKSSQKWSVQRSAVRSIAWLGLSRLLRNDCVAWDRIVRTKVSLLVWWQLIGFVGHADDRQGRAAKNEVKYAHRPNETKISHRWRGRA